MQTKKLFSSLVRTGTRLMVFTTMLVALIGNVSGVAAAPSPVLGTVTVGAQSGTLTEGTAGSVTFSVVVSRTNPQSSSPSSFNLSVTGLPSGASGVFSASNPVSFSGGGQTTQQVTLTVNTSTGAASGSTNFTVSAFGAGTTITGSGTLTIDPAAPLLLSPTITFDPAPSPTYPGSDFTVSATTDSDGALTYSYVSGPCTLVDGNLGTFSSTGVGTCVVQADTAETATFAAGSTQQSVDITAATVLSTPTITFDPAPSPTYPGSDFTVSATTDSDGALTYSYVSGPCTLVDGNLGTFSSTGVGTCVVQADTAETATFAAGSTQQSVDITASGPGPVTDVSIDLCATTGSLSMPGGVSVPVWGYALGDCSDNPSASVPGPALTFTQGQSVGITLHNNLSEGTALLFQGQSMLPDLSGAAAGGMRTYYFTATDAGTFLYESGLMPNEQHQVAMGMYGALIINPATAGQAYGDPSTAFASENTLVLSELDPALNNSADPAAFDMRDYNPQYFLINGKTFPDTDSIPVSAGETVLMRYVNAGLQAHAMSLLGLSQTIIAQDGNPYLYSHNVVAETIATGQTLDTLVTIPAAAADGSQFALYDANMLLHNTDADGFGGMLTFLAIPGTGGGTSGPITSNVLLTPNPSDGTSPVTLTATIGTAGDPDIDAAEFFVDTVGAAGSGCAITTGLGTAPAGVSATIPTSGATAPCTDLATLASGNHTFFVHGHNANGWGAVASAVLNLDKAGPAISALTLSPDPSDGSVDLNLTFTASDVNSGNSDVTAAEYWVDSGAPQALGFTPAPSVNLNAVIPAGLSAGTHTVSVQAQDALGNLGAIATIGLTIDTTGPTTSNVSAAPNPNNGSTPLNTSTPAVRITANFSDGETSVAGAEGFIDTVGTIGTGFEFIATDGSFDSAFETGFGDIPIAVVGNLSEGNHTIFVLAKDAAGNWGPSDTTTLTIDKSAPTFDSLTLSPNPTNGASTVTLTVNGATGSPTGGEYWIGDTVPAIGGGTAFTGLTADIDVSAMLAGAYTVSARLHDAANNWTAYKSTTLTVVQDVIFSDGFESGDASAWTSRSTNSSGRLSVTNGAALVDTYGLQASGNNSNFVQYDFAVPSAPTFDAHFYFDPNGNTGSDQPIFAASSVGGGNNAFNNNILFQVLYSWNGGSPQVQAQVGTATITDWVSIADLPHTFELVWQSGNTLDFYVDGVLSQTLTAGNGSVASVRLGSISSGGNNTQEFFDAFSSKRSVTPLIGP